MEGASGNEFFPNYEDEAGRCAEFLTKFRQEIDPDLIGTPEEDEFDPLKYHAILVSW